MERPQILTGIDVDLAEKLFFAGGLVCVLAAYVLHHNCAAKFFCDLDLGAMCVGLLFAVVNFHTWKLFVEIYLESCGNLSDMQKSSSWARRGRTSLVFGMKALAILLLIGFLSTTTHAGIVSFLFSFTAFLLAGVLLTGCCSAKRKGTFRSAKLG
jgi:hypothetical protein